MAENDDAAGATGATGPAGDNGTTGAAQQDTGTSQSQDTTDWKAMARKHEREAKAARDRLQELEDKDKSELEKATERANAAEKRAADLEVSRTRLMVAAKHGLDADLADRLRGSTEEELEADAKSLAERFGGKTTSTTGSGDQGSRGRSDAASSDDPNRVMNAFLAGRAR